MSQSDKTDRWLESARASLRQEAAPPRLWQNLTAELERPATARPAWLGWWQRRWIPALATASLLLLAVLSLWLLQPSGRLISPARARHYALEIDGRVFDAQRAYERKIAVLEQQVARLNLAVTDDRWQQNFATVLVLDLQINECKTTLKNNPYNPTVHENLVAGYRHKIDSLNAILTTTEERHV